MKAGILTRVCISERVRVGESVAMTEKSWDERMAERRAELDRAATELTQLVKETFKEALHDLGAAALEGEKLGREIAELRNSLAEIRGLFQ